MTIVRKTKSVGILMDVFNNSQKALSVVELVDRFRGKMNKTTIYRILDKLEKEMFIHSFLGVQGLKWYAKCQGCASHHHNDAHPHFQCQSCGKLDCLETIVSIPTITGRKVKSAQVLLIGDCEQCMSL